MASDAVSDPAHLVVKLQGGIGNQLFQLGFGHYLQQTAGSTVSYWADAFLTDPYGRQSMVQRVRPDVPFVSLPDIAGPACRMLQESALSGPLDPGKLMPLLESQRINHCILDGYWQDNTYISDEFAHMLKSAMDAQALKSASTNFNTWANRIGQSQRPVAVHVRRHDYKHHGLCHEAYYIDSLRWIGQQMPDSEVFVFSDEPNYTGHFLRQAGIAHQMVRSGDDLMDLLLIARCRLHILANSSYSWWGARLAGSEGVLYPRPWSHIQEPAAAMFPAHWWAVDEAVAFGHDAHSYTDQLAAISWTSILP